MKNKIVVSSITAALSLSSVPTFAEDNTIIVSANRIKQDVNDTLTDVIIIDRAEIERKQPQSLVDLLANIPGVDYTKTGGHGQDASVFIRGSNSNQLLVLIDGVRVGSATLGSKAVSTIPVAQIERIEIVKGPRAAIWGSDAIGGVIQIFTRNYRQGQYRVELSAGSNSTLELDAAVGFGDEKLNTTLIYSNKSSDGFDVLASAEPDKDGYENESIAIKGGYLASDVSEYDWLFQSDKGETFFDSAFNPDSAANVTEYDNQLWKFGYTLTAGHWLHSVSLSGSKDSARGFETEKEQVSYDFQNQVNNQFSLSGGLDFLYDDVSGSLTQYDERKRDTQSVFLAANYVGSTFLVDVAIRNDDVEKVANETTSNIGVGFRISPEHLVSLNYGEGFKAPTFNDLYFPNFGNPELKFETSENLELVYKGQFGDSRLTLSVYETDTENLIQFGPNGAENIGLAEVSGIDLTYQFSTGDFNHKITADNIDAKDGNTGARLIRRAKNRVGYELNYVQDSFDWFLQVQNVGKRPDTDFSTFTAVELESFTRLNLGVGYQFNDELRIQLNINDLTDEAPIMVTDYNPVEREFYLSASYRVE
ncbi:TonB-dependent receptor [Aliikangiella marina]|uniref:TonB-dependent receptor n=1 Tax=Aliikangiella marina TaxID=1712262 RepID=A0A545TCQ2_9GAMM|nr:TonB-dependent receptor [Aliikangiella marina]TQV74998.1 TonB-dependent receptor [Aliikangiella marina]